MRSEFPIGAVLRSVVYEMHFRDKVPHPDDLFDETSMAVTLGWQDGRTSRVGWVPNGFIEGLEFDGPPRDVGAHDRDVTSRWGVLVGARLTAAQYRYQRPWQELPWAVTLLFDHGRSLTIGLGELEDGVPSYMPNNLLISGSPELLSAYVPFPG